MDRSTLAADSAGGVCEGLREVGRLGGEAVATIMPWVVSAAVVVTLANGDGSSQSGRPVSQIAVPVGAALPAVGRRAREVWPALEAAVLRIFPDATRVSLYLEPPPPGRPGWIPVATPGGPFCPSPSQPVSASAEPCS